MSDVLTVEAIIQEVRDRGLTLRVEKGEPRLKGPREQMTPALIAVLIRRRNEIIQWLTPPHIIHWLTQDDIPIHTMPDRNQYIPIGAVKWQLSIDGDKWRPLSELPPEWGIIPRPITGKSEK